MVVLDQTGAQRLVDNIMNRLPTAVSNAPDGVTTTAAGTAAKIVGINNFISRRIGTRILVEFPLGNTAATPTLNVNATGAGQIWFRGAVAGGATHIPPGHITDLMWDGTRWQLLNSATGLGLWTGTVTTAVGTAAKVLTITGFAAANRVVGQLVEGFFTVGNSSTAATLNVTATGAAGIRFNNSVPVLVAIRAMYHCYFVWDGTFWQLLNPANVDPNGPAFDGDALIM